MTAPVHALSKDELVAENERMRRSLERIRERVMRASRYDGEDKAYFYLGAIGVEAALGLGDSAALLPQDHHG